MSDCRLRRQRGMTPLYIPGWRRAGGSLFRCPRRARAGGACRSDRARQEGARTQADENQVFTKHFESLARTRP